MKSRKAAIAAIAAAVVAYMEEEKALRPAVVQRKSMVSSPWGSHWNEEMMQILWQRGIVPRVMIFGGYLNSRS